MRTRGQEPGQKQSLYLPQELLDALRAEAVRLDRSLSWLIQRCVRVALPDVRALQAVDEPVTREVGTEAAE